MYASLCDFVCTAFTICPRVLSAHFCLFVFLICSLVLVIIGGFVSWFGCSPFLSLFFFLNYFLIFLIFINFKIFFKINNFIYFYFFLSFFLPFLMSCVADRVLVLRPAVRPVPLRWESQVQDIAPQKTSHLHVISNGESSSTDLHLNAKTQFHSTTSKLQ